MVDETGVVKYSIVEAEIQKWKSIYMDLMIDDLNDKEQFDAVHSARMVVKNGRVAIEKERKNLNSEAIAWQKKVNGRAKELFSLIEPIETHLSDQEQKVIDEQNRIKAEEEARQVAEVKLRTNLLLEVGCVMAFTDVAVLTDDEFNELLSTKRYEYDAEQKRKTEEAEALKAENERLAKQKEEQDKIAADLKRQRDEIAAQQKAIQDEKDRIAREEQAKKNAEEAKIKAEAEAKAKIEREAKEAEEKQIAAEKEARRQEALRPDKEKIQAWLMDIELKWLNKYPADVSEEAAQFIAVIRDEFAAHILDFRKELENF